MPAHRMNMRMIKDVLRLKFDGGFSHDRIVSVSTKVDGPMSKINEGRSAKRL